MKIEKLLPSGFCYGVLHSYNKTLEIIEHNPHKKIYMLGWLVHNQTVINELLAKHVIILDDTNISRYTLINEFSPVTNAILILSAHGTDHNTIALAKAKGFEVYDLTCKLVYKTHEAIKQKLNAGYEIIFIGKKNHPETNAILGINNKIILISDLIDLLNLKISSNKIFCTNQTTFNTETVRTITKQLFIKYPHIIFQNDICNATFVRQKAIINMSPLVDVCLIIGDQKSSNAKELFALASQKTEAHFISCLHDIKPEWFINKQQCAIAAATSTPLWLIDEIYQALCKKYLDN